MTRTSTRLRYLAIDTSDLQWIAANIGRALERARRDTHPGIAPNGLTADDGSHPGPIPHLFATRAVSGDEVRRAREQLLEALDAIHKATMIATHAIHRLLPMNQADARTLAENETIDPTPLPCSNCLNPAEPGRSQCAACRKYRARHGTDRPTNLTTKATSHSNTPLALAMPTTPAQKRKEGNHET